MLRMPYACAGVRRTAGGGLQLADEGMMWMVRQPNAAGGPTGRGRWFPLQTSAQLQGASAMLLEHIIFVAFSSLFVNPG